MVQDWLERLRAYWSAGRRNQVIVAASVAVLIAIIWGSVALATRGNAPAATAQATETSAPQVTPSPAGTPHPTATPTKTPTPLPTKPVAKAFVGGTQAGFNATYGKPISTGVDSGNNLPTANYRGTGPIAGITIEMDSTRSYVVGVVVTAASNSPWDATTVNVACPLFAPSDASFDQAQSVADQNNTEIALYETGHSPTLASSLPANVFTDNQGQPVSAGTFTTEIYYVSGSQGKLAYACSQRLGNQPVSPGA